MPYLPLSHVRALAKANGHERLLEQAITQDRTGELFCLREGTKIYRYNNPGEKQKFLLYGYGNQDVERTLERLYKLPGVRKPKPKQTYLLKVNGHSHWGGSWESCCRERRELRASGSKAQMRIEKMEGRTEGGAS